MGENGHKKKKFSYDTSTDRLSYGSCYSPFIIGHAAFFCFFFLSGAPIVLVGRKRERNSRVLHESWWKPDTETYVLWIWKGGILSKSVEMRKVFFQREIDVYVLKWYSRIQGAFKTVSRGGWRKGRRLNSFFDYAQNARRDTEKGKKRKEDGK